MSEMDDSRASTSKEDAKALFEGLFEPVARAFVVADSPGTPTGRKRKFAAADAIAVACFYVALLYAPRALKDVKTANFDQKVGVDIMANALTVPCKTIASNAGEEGAVIVGKLLESTDTNYGFNAQVGEYCDMVAAGIIDPTKVVRAALQDAASIAGLLITTEAMVAEKPEPADKAAGGMPDMGGMGGMDF